LPSSKRVKVKVQNSFHIGLPRLWCDVEPDARYSGIQYIPIEEIEALPEGSEIDKSFIPISSNHAPFLPYVEKETWCPNKAAPATLDGRGININTLSNWLGLCSQLHGDRCRRNLFGQSSEHTRPSLLIDAIHMNLVHAKKDMQYAALSYVWGNTPSDCTRTDNLPLYLSPGAFDQPSIILPQVIRDAIELVRKLKLQFLWVDRFCIPQDDVPDKQSQIDNMALIYAHASFTVFAAQNENSLERLYGTRKLFEPEDHPHTEYRKLYRYPGYQLKNKEFLHLLSRSLMCTPWYSRGWTFQEHLFSQRKIIFHDNSVAWECQHASWYEGQELSGILKETVPIGLGPPSPIIRMINSPYPDMYRYARFVCLYNRMELTLPEDIFDAFRSAFGLIGRSYHGKNLSGLPEMFFNASLLWQPWHPLTRRIPDGRNGKLKELPSWSWMGWRGDIAIESWMPAYSYLQPIQGRGVRPADNLSGCRVIPTIEWSWSQTLSGDKQRVIDYSQQLHDLSTEELMKHGWKQCNSPKNQVMDKNVKDELYFQHERHPNHVFGYPIPIVETLQDQITLINPSYLYTNTTTAQLKLGKLFVSKVCYQLDVIEVLGCGGRAIGVLRLNIPSGHMDWAECGSCELIELSRGSFEGSIDGSMLLEEWYHLPQLLKGNETGLYEFYNVMWIKWDEVDGTRVARRRAVGRILKKCWDAVATTRIAVILG
jgi:hypothetical protein